MELPLAVLSFFAMAVFLAGFEVADTQMLFSLAPASGATATLVVAAVVSSTLNGVAPIVAGLGLEAALAFGAPPLHAYGVLFSLAAIAQLVALVPLSRVRA